MRYVRRAILAFALIAPLLAFFVWKDSPFLAIAIVFASHMLVLYPTLRASSQWLGRVVTEFAPRDGEVWITIDDGPSDQTLAILEALKRHGARATFFVKGANVVARPDEARTIVAAGCEIANHSQSHPSGSFWVQPKSRIAREIDECNAALERFAGVRTRRFRAPVGMKNPFVHPLLAERGMTLIGWSARAFDGVGSAGVEQMLDRIRRDLRPGAIILLHEGRRSNPAVIEALLEELDRRGLRAVIPSDEQLLPSEDQQVIVKRRALP